MGVSSPPFSKTALVHSVDSRDAPVHVPGVHVFSLAVARYASGCCRSIWGKFGGAGRGGFGLSDLPPCAGKTKSPRRLTFQMLAGFVGRKRLFTDRISAFNVSPWFDFWERMKHDFLRIKFAIASVLTHG